MVSTLRYGPNLYPDFNFLSLHGLKPLGEEPELQKGIIRRRGNRQVIGCWRADVDSIVVETDDPELRQAADEILRTPQTIPVHGPEHGEFASQADPSWIRPPRSSTLPSSPWNWRSGGPRWSRRKNGDGSASEDHTRSSAHPLPAPNGIGFDEFASRSACDASWDPRNPPFAQ